MAITREQTHDLIGGMNSGLLSDTIANPAFNADARRFGVEILMDRKAIQANLPIFGVLVKSISDERAIAAAKAAAEAAAAAKAAEEAAAAVKAAEEAAAAKAAEEKATAEAEAAAAVKRAADVKAAIESEARYERGKAIHAEVEQHEEPVATEVK